VRVLDLSNDLAGSYCTKLLGDAGAEVLKVEPPLGHPLRHWSRTGSLGRDGDPDGVLFRFLAAGQRSLVADLDDPAGHDRVLELLAASDITVSSSPAEQLEARGLRFADVHEVNHELTVVSLTPFGLTGPRSGQFVNDFLLQALSGSLHNHGSSRREPLAVGGGLGEWIAGAYGAAGALAARARLHRTGSGELVDVSSLEALAVTLVCYPSVAASVAGGARRRATVEMVPGIESCKDGFVGLTTLTAQQWHDFLAMIDRPDLIDNARLDSTRARVGHEAELRPMIHGWTEQHEVAEIIERAAMFRVPAAPVLNGATLPQFEPLADRGLFTSNPRGGFSHPRPPFLSTATDPRPVAPAPSVGEHATTPFRSGRPTSPRNRSGEDGCLPLEGVRVLDVTAFWAGPSATQYLATLGAEVIKVESVQRPDSMRFNVSASPKAERWWEQGYLFLSANLNKRGITLNLGDDRGRQLFLQLAARSDVVVENFTPRVMGNFKLTYDAIREVRSDVVMVSMPGWGLEGPWRDRPGFATTMEQASGMAFVTGYDDGPPMAPGLCDPLAGVHGAFGVLAALEERRKTGRGQHVELPMIDLAVNVSAEQILEFEAYGELMTRRGNRCLQAAPQGVYACAGADEWLALSVTTEEQWRALCEAIGVRSWAADPELATVGQRHAAHDRIDAAIGSWCANQELTAALYALGDAGAQPVVPAYDIDEDPQMQARGFWEPVVHPVVGEHRYPGWPMRLSGGPGSWYRSPAPLLGQHNEEVLTGLLGLALDEIADLQQAGVIGERPLGL
jgi:crotonobetainyl-CoA:carnitine CoA-transferase CaiB-like acyl-CoA transferase